MAYIYYNPNPLGNRIGDCVIRAISKATRQPWIQTYIELCRMGIELCDMPSANYVWGEYLVSKGFESFTIPNTCPRCYTVREFCRDHPYGLFVLATGEHAVTVKDGDYYDTWDSGDEVPTYFWKEIKRNGGL